MWLDKKKGEENAAPVHYKEVLANLNALVGRLSSKIQGLEANEEAQKQLREITNQKFDKLNEQIGEVRELFKVISSDKKELEVRIGQTVETVKQVQPTQIEKQLDSFGDKVAVIEGKIQLVAKQYDSFRADFDHFNHKLNIFKGEDELIKLQQRIKQDLDDVSKASHQASMHASKIENHFIKINEKSSAIATSVSELRSLREDLRKLQIDLTRQATTAKAAGGDDLNAMQQKLAELEETVGGLADLSTETFTGLKRDIADANRKTGKPAVKSASDVDPAEFEKLRKWVVYLAQHAKR